MCKWGARKKVNVIRRANPFVPDGWHEIYVDSCLADLVQELNSKGIVTVQCCCGHSKGEGEVWIAEESTELAKDLGYKLEFRDDPDRNVINTGMVNNIVY